jgi:hypothetical protein
LSTLLAEFRRWLHIRFEPRPRIPPPLPLEGFAHRLVLLGWPLVFCLLWAAKRRDPGLQAPPALYALAAKTLAVTAGAWLSARLRLRCFKAARPRWRAFLAVSDLADRILEFLPKNVGMPLSEIVRRLGHCKSARLFLPAALEGLGQDGLIERFSKTGREPEPMYRFAAGQARLLRLAGALGLAELSNDRPSLSIAQLARNSSSFNGLTERHHWRALRRLIRRGLIRRLPPPRAQVVGGQYRYAITGLGRRTVKCAEALYVFLPYHETGRTMSFAEIAARTKEELEVVRAALDFEKDLGICEEFVAGPDDCNPRFWATFDKRAVHQWAETWQDRLAKRVN